MVGRANLGNPYKINEIINYCNGIDNNFLQPNEKLNIIKEHLELAVKEKGEYVGIREMRKHICWYIKNLKDSSKVRDIVNKLESKDEVIACLEEYFKNL